MAALISIGQCGSAAHLSKAKKMSKHHRRNGGRRRRGGVKESYNE
jgi:hypothetical protein